MAALLLMATHLGWAQTKAEVTDVLNRELTGVTGTSYTEWSDKTSNSDAVYAGQSAGGNESIQLRSNNSNSGIITTASGGTVTKVTVTWNANTTDGRTLQVYGKESAFTSPTELYNASTQGTLIGEIVKGTNTELTIDESFSYIGMRSKTGAMYLTEIDVIWTSGGTPNPSITASNVGIEYNATSGSIAYTVNNPVSGGTMSAACSDSWLSLGTVNSSAVPFTCSANSSGASRTATVTLTYTHSGGTATRNVTVTQAANPNAINTISEITAAGTYTVQGTIVAKSQRGFIVGDGTGYVYYYNQNYTQADYNLGDMVRLAGPVVVYGGVFEFNSTTTVTAATSSNYVAEEPTVLTGEDMDARVASTTPPQLSNYIQFTGTLSISGTHYNITDIEGATTAIGSISYPLDTQFTSLDGTQVIVTGYFVGISTSTYYNTMIGSIEEVQTGGPSIAADPVDIDYNTTSGNIAYNVSNPVAGGSVTASCTETWLTLGTANATAVPFTCTVNKSSASRTATVTLTYTYSGGTATRNVNVTQAGDPNSTNSIEEITAAGTYIVQGTIVAKSVRGFIVGDGTGYVYYYNQEYAQEEYNLGDMVRIAGNVKIYGGVFEFDNTATITAAESSNYIDEEPTVLTGAEMDARVSSGTPAQLSDYVQYEGTLSISGTHYNITNIDGAETAKGSISYPIDTDFASLDGRHVIVKGYYVGVSSSQYYNTMLGTIEATEPTGPEIMADNITLEYNETSGAIGYYIDNAVAGGSLTATCDASWLTLGTVGDYLIPFTVTENMEDADRTATVTLTYTYANGNVTKAVIITQKHYVIDYAELPFSFNGGLNDIDATNGLTQNGLGKDYGTDPKLKFDNTGDWLILKFNERPGRLSFDIKGNTFSGGTFTVQTSEDGETYTDLASYTELTTTVETPVFDDLGENVRYIKWIYTEKVNGNVGLGGIELGVYGAPVNYTLTLGTPEHITLNATYGTNNSLSNGESGTLAGGTTVSLSVTVEEGYVLDEIHATDMTGSPVTLNPAQIEGAYTFNMPNSDVTVNATAKPSSVVTTMTIAEVRAQQTGEVSTAGTVTSVNGKTAYIQDATAAICVYGNANLNLAIGDYITVAGTLSTYRGLLEITAPTYEVVSQGNTVTPTVMTIEAINTDFAGENAWQGWLTRIQNATVTEINGQNTSIEQNGNSIVVRGISSDVTFVVGDVLSLTGNIGCFDTPQIVHPTDVEVQASGNPVINADNAVTLAYDATSGEIAYTVTNAVAGTNLNATTDANWISNLTVATDKVTFTTSVNNSDADRTATITLSYNGATDKTVTVTQEHYVADFAELPFHFDDGRAEIANTAGLTQEGLDTDYASSPKLKFKNTDSWVLLQFNERPGKLSFDIKGNSFSGGTFSVQTSEDGENFTDLAVYTELGATQSPEFNNLGENVRYIKWIYTEKVNGNVALGNINLEPYSVPQEYVLSVYDPLHVTITATYGNTSLTNGDHEDVLSGTAITVSVAVEEGYILEALTVTNAEGEPVSVTHANDSWSFYMPNSDVDIDATAVVAPVVETTTYTMVTSIESGRHYIITNGANKAMGGQNNNNRAGVDITVTEGVASVTSDAGVCELVINGPDVNGNYTIYDATTPGYLFAASSGSNYLRTREFNIDANSQWTITFDEENSAVITAQGSNTRNLMRFNSSSNIFSCYGSGQNPIYLYLKDEDTNYEFFTDVMGYGEEEGGWQLIASPVNSNTDPTEAMLSNEYDLYAFDATQSMEWRNHKAAAFQLAPKAGYLYANSANTTLHFEGQPNTNGGVTIAYTSSSSHNGWNLIGNPFGQAAYLADGRSFYVMNEEGTNIILAEDNGINMGQGIFVVATSANDNQVTFTTTAPTKAKALAINLSEDNVLVDRSAIRFDNSRNLEKVMLNNENSHLFFAQDGSKYAVVNAESRGEKSLIIKVKAHTQYTISVSMENISFERLVLIDSLTGDSIDLLKNPNFYFQSDNEEVINRFKIEFVEKK